MAETRVRIAPAVAAAALALLSILTPRPAHAVDWRAEAAAKDAIKKTGADFASGDWCGVLMEIGNPWRQFLAALLQE